MQFKEHGIFALLTSAQREQLMSFSRRQKFIKGNILFFEGEEPKSLYFLLLGKIKIYKSDARGNEVVLHYLQAPNFVAELAHLEKIKYPASAVFESDGEVLAIEYARFENEFLKNGEIAFHIIKSLTHKITILEGIITGHLLMNTTMRVARFLHDHISELPKLSQRKIATLINTTPETLSRVLKKLKEQGHITMSRGVIISVDKEALKREFGLL